MTDTDQNPRTHVVVLLGSLRADSVNRRIAERLQADAPDGVSVEIAEGLASLPFYNEELDGAEVPAAARALRELVGGADRVLAITPEYNGTMPAVLNNAIDWLSRPYGVSALSGKPFAAIGATPTRLGGKWSHEDARRSAGVAGAVVLNDLVLSHSSLEADALTDSAAYRKFLDALVTLAEHEVETAAA
jgi:NAD(P)H-dependent FMN reductase